MCLESHFDIADLFQIVSTTEGRDNLYTYYELGLVAPVDDMFAMMPERTANHYNNQMSANVDSNELQW